jgi:hypothetical protein
VLDPGADSLGRLANSLGRPRASLAAFSHLQPAQHALLTDAIERAAETRRTEVDEALRRVLPRAAVPAVAHVLRARGVPALRRLLLRRVPEGDE